MMIASQRAEILAMAEFRAPRSIFVFDSKMRGEARGDSDVGLMATLPPGIRGPTVDGVFGEVQDPVGLRVDDREERACAR